MQNFGGENKISVVQPKKAESERERYAGICDVFSPYKARHAANKLRQYRHSKERKIMIGVMAHKLTLNPDLEDPSKVRDVFPAREKLAGGFTDDPDVLNTIHYADLYGPHAGKNVLENLELCVEYGGENLHALQLDITWPNVNDIKKFKEKHPELIIVLQVGKFAMKDINGNAQELVNRLREYGDSIDHVLLDMSMGKGEGMDAEGLLVMLRAIRKELPNLGLAVAGGLGPDTIDLLKPIAKEFPDISFDAQGNLKHNARKDELGHMISSHPAHLTLSKEYIKKSCAMLDGAQPE